MEKLYIIDASGFLYRSYFAIKNITNDKGESTNALYGFIRSVMKLRKDFNPEHLIAVFDGPQSIQLRASYYPEYKAHRAKTPPDLAYQIGWAQQACELMGIPFLAVPGLEADDTMGSIALWAAQQDALVYLCTSDKDMCQVVNDRISILNVHKENLILGPKEVEENFGVPPNQIIDYLAIIGDASDNIPGLPGFGPKTAVALLKEHGTLEYILDHPEVVSGKKQEIITQFRDQALLSKRLVILHTIVDFPKSRDFFSINPPPAGPLKEFYARMNFNSLLRELEASSPQSSPEIAAADAPPVSFTLVDDEASFTTLLAHISEQTELCIHTIMSEEQPIKAQLIGIGFCTAPQRCQYVPTNGNLGLQRVIDGIKKVLESPYIDIYGHNIKSDVQVLANYGVHIAKISFDTMLASYLLNSHRRQHELEQIVLELYGKALPKLNDLLGKGKSAISLEAVPLDVMTKYCCENVDYISRLKGVLKTQLEERGLWPLLNDLELPLLSVLAEMERHGIFLDIPCLEAISVDVMHQIAGLEQEIYALAGETFNLNSPKQLSVILFEKMGIKAPKKNATGLSTNVDVLEALKEQYPIAGKILEYRTVEKLRSTYIDTFPNEVNPKTQRIHCTFNQSVAATGRLSCQNPNLQNIPIKTEAGRKIRTAFRPQKEGWSYLAADYSQIELRLLAHLSEDPTLIDAFNSGEDIHIHTAANIFNIPLNEVTKEQRRSAKAVNFGVIYGQQAFGLAQEIGTDVKVAAAFIEAYFKRYSRVKDFIEACKEQARQTGKSVTYTGRERLIPEIHNKNGQIRALAERLAVNTPLQGTAADLIKLAMLEIDKKIKQKQLSGFLILQIHDELIFELPNEEIAVMEPLVREAMQGVFSLKVPLVVDIELGKNWAEC
jgi:DNA polymerase-1